MKRILYCILFCTIFFNQFLSEGFAQSNNFIVQEVKFISEGVTLAGSMIVPPKARAAVVVVHGSDPVKRELEFAKLLASKGIAVLTYDKRGVGESGGVYVGPTVGTNNIDSANLHLLALDASAAINLLRASMKSKQLATGLVGFSQAGWIIPLAAEKNRFVDFMVIFSGPVVTTLEQLRFQFYTNGDESFWNTHAEAEAKYHIKNDPDKYQFEATDPVKSLAKLSIPGLWIYGEKDIQVPVQLSVERLDALKAQNKNYTYKRYPNLGHNTAFSTSAEPVEEAIKWMKAIQLSLNGRR